ncbi:DNA/RNA helicase domain-containing protein [Mucilaginibacter defluvii]|uniref:DNA 3'-5' helicase II n=1 Tax=Mucilaginibacter defluvii TaxID=1196019 RepID=A0ABP9G0Z9_9SPHI
MPREKWLIDPSELDEFQRKIRGLSINESYVIKGCPGSGKTLLALYRALDIYIESLAEDEDDPASFTLVVYTKALKGFLRSGIIELKIPIHQIIHFDKWDGADVDYIIVDEAQDFTQSEIDELSNASMKSIMLYGDSEQQLYKEKKNKETEVYESTLTIEQIADHLKLDHFELLKNYRLPNTIAALAEHISADKTLEAKCVKTGMDKPRLKKFVDWKKELDYIMNEIKTRNYTDVAILVPFTHRGKAPKNNYHRNIPDVNGYFDEKGFAHEYKVSSYGENGLEIDFESNLPKLLTYHASKGLQFETVFIPFCDYPGHDDWFIERYQAALFVGLTRSYRNLYITHSDGITPFFDGLSPSKYQ